MRRRTVPSVRYISLCALLLCPIGSLGETRTSIEEQLEQLTSSAQAAQQRGDYREAIKSYEALAKLRPDVAEIWANLGLMHQFVAEYSDADHCFEVALVKNPKLYVPNLFLGLNQIRVHQPHAALPFLKTAVLVNPRDEQAALGLARAYSGVQDDNNAARWFERARQLAPQDPEVWYGLGMSYLRLQDRAVRELKKLDADEVRARILVADSFVEQERIQDAIRIYEKFRSQPQPPCVLSSLGFAYAQLGSIENANQSFRDETRRHSECLLAHIGLAHVALVIGDFAEVFKQLQLVNDRDSNFLDGNLYRVWTGMGPEQMKTILAQLAQEPWNHDPLASRTAAAADPAHATAMASSPAQTGSGKLAANPSIARLNPETLWAQGRYTACAERLHGLRMPSTAALTRLREECTFYAGQYRRSLDASDDILRTSAHDPDGLYWKARSAEALAANAFAQVSVVAPDSSKVHLLMADMHRAKQELPAAESEYKLALATSDDPIARLGLAHVYFENSADDKALEQLQQVLKSDSSNMDAHSLMGEILVRHQQYDEAVPHLRVALAGPSIDLPQVHSLLAKCYSAQGQYAQALAELKPALPADTMGVFHYQAYQIYLKLGDRQSAAAALQASEELRHKESDAEQERTRAIQP